jgi:hypothetical protein
MPFCHGSDKLNVKMQDEPKATLRVKGQNHYNTGYYLTNFRQLNLNKTVVFNRPGKQKTISE